MKFILLLFVTISAASCQKPDAQKMMVLTSSRIIKALCEHDSVALSGLFNEHVVYDKRYAANVIKGFNFCNSYAPADTLKYKVGIDNRGRNVYLYFVTIHFTDKTTHLDKGRITLGFSNQFGFDKALWINVEDYSERRNRDTINFQQRMPAVPGLSKEH